MSGEKDMFKSLLAIALVMWFLLAFCPLLSAQQDPPRPDCCLAIFYAGHHLGMAFALAEEGYFSQELIDGLNNAARFVQIAHSSCSAVNPAWPDWETRQAELRQWVERLRRDPEKDTFNKAAAYLQNSRMSYGERLAVQIIASRFVRQATCEEKYFKIGFDQANAQICLILAAGASASREARIDYIVEAQQAFDRLRTDLDELAQVRPVTGFCAPLADLRTRLGGWRANYDSGALAQSNQLLLAGVFKEAESRLGDCRSSSGGRAGGGATIASAVGRWTLSHQEYDAASRRWTTVMTEPQPIELYGTRGPNGYEGSEGTFWNIVDGKLSIGDPSTSGRMVFTLQPDGIWIGFGYESDGTLMSREKRIVLRRADR
jgi:hypothetical protein